MARFLQKRKRSNGAPQMPKFKRRRFSRFGARKNRRTTGFTSRSTGFSSGLFSRPRKLTFRRRRQYRNEAWKRSSLDQKFKAIESFNTFTGVLSALTASPVWTHIKLYEAFDRSAPFWTPGGGLRGTNFAIPIVIPTLTPNKVFIRGGIIELGVGYALRNIEGTSTESDMLNVSIQLVYPKQQQRNFTNANDVAPRFEWTSQTATLWPRKRLARLQDEADYDEYFHPPVIDKTFTMTPGSSINLRHKLRPKIIDTDQWMRGFGSFPIWIIYSNANTLMDTTLPACEHTRSYRVSFTLLD